jgi:O-phospho-L-seryl-tRNASec:L-selenocysteinyl-tRNA synthase
MAIPLLSAAATIPAAKLLACCPGSSMLAKLAAHLAGDALSLAGLADLPLPQVLPSATGMALTLVLLAAAGAPAAVRAGPASNSNQQQSTAAGTSAAPTAAERASLQAQKQQQQQSTVTESCAERTAEGTSLQQQQQQGAAAVLPRYVVWSRIDQKTCLKAITAANLVPVVVQLLQQGDELVTDVAGIQQAVEELGAASVAAVVTTTSCFAPR